MTSDTNVGYRCPDCGYVHENSPACVNAHVEPGDYCPKCGRQFTAADRETRGNGELWPWEKDPDEWGEGQ